MTPVHVASRSTQRSSGLLRRLSGVAPALVVHDAAGGNLQWTFTGDSQLSYPPVIANGFVYVTSDENSYGVDISLHLAVDHEPIGGWLLVANHRLIVGTEG